MVNTPTVKIVRTQIAKSTESAPPSSVVGVYPNGVSEEDLGLPTLEPSYSSEDPDNEEERKEVHPDLLLEAETEKEKRAVVLYFERTRNKKAAYLLDNEWDNTSKSPLPEEPAPRTLRRPRLSLCMAAVSMMR